MKNLLYMLSLIAILQACDITTETRDAVIPKDVKEEVVEKKAETLILMHSRQAIRLEYNVDQQKLDLWISPKPGKSTAYFDRNFSNRDDYTSLFDKISFPNLKLEDFESCDYEPFHSVINFKKQKLHIATIYDKPAVIVWTESPEIIDIKTDKADIAFERNNSIFSVKHPDRGYDFHFIAALGDTLSSFQHQLQIDRGRSTFARVHLSANSPLYLVGGLAEEYLPYAVRNWVTKPVEDYLADTKAKVDKIAGMGRVVVKEDEELQKLLDINKRIYISMQDESGAIRASIQYIYYLIWVRDGGLSSPFLGYSGWTETLDKWTRFQLANPTVITNEEPTGRFFGQLVNGKITKWEEDGAFFALWSAFAYWTQTGNNDLLNWQNLKLMEDAVKWVEDYCYDGERKAFGRYHYCESPLTGSRGNGWDNAVGNPTNTSLTKFQVNGEDKVIVRSYDIFINNLMYATYMMLSSMEYGEKSDLYLAKAKEIEPFLNSLYKGNNLPDYGLLISDKGEEITAGPYGMDITDYVWSLSLPHFYPKAANLDSIRLKLFNNMMEKPQRYFFAGYFSLLASMDIEHFDQDTMMSAVQYAAEQCYRPGKYLPMPYTMIEMSDVPDGDKYHDIRPQAFTIGSWLGAMANFGIHRDAYGVSLRPSKYLKVIEDYHYKNAVIDINYSGSGEISKVLLNGIQLENTLQIPDKLLKDGDNQIQVIMEDNFTQKNLLISSSIKLNNAAKKDAAVHYSIYAFGMNDLTFKNMSKDLKVFDAYNKEVEVSKITTGDYTTFSFDGKGIFRVEVQ